MIEIPIWLFHLACIFGGVGIASVLELIYEIVIGKRKFRGFK